MLTAERRVCSSRTAMIATVSLGQGQYHHTLNTLKYADRAKEIKTHVRRNTASVAVHVAQMRAIILQLQQQNSALKAMLNSPAVGACARNPHPPITHTAAQQAAAWPAPLRAEPQAHGAQSLTSRKGAMNCDHGHTCQTLGSGSCSRLRLARRARASP